MERRNEEAGRAVEEGEQRIGGSGERVDEDEDQDPPNDPLSRVRGSPELPEED